jgi:hypothetical protein
MKTDKLEKFVIDHRSDFDDLEPNPAIWDKIQKKQPKKIELNWTNILVRVAAVIVIFVSSYYFHDFMNRRGVDTNLATETKSTDGEQQYHELIEAEVYYTSMIDSKKEEIFMLAASKPQLREEINNELTDLDEDFRSLKEDLKDNADNEEVIVAMIQNYRLKLRILEETLIQLQQSNNEKSKNNEDNKVLL